MTELDEETTALLQNYLDGELNVDEDCQLAALIRSDEAVRHELIDSLIFDQALRQSLDDCHSEEAFLQALNERLRPRDLSSTTWRERVESHLPGARFHERQNQTVAKPRMPFPSQNTRCGLEWGKLLALASCIVAAATGYLYYQSHAALREMSLQVVRVESESSQPGNNSTITRGQILPPGKRIETSADTRVVLQYPDKSAVTLMPGSVLEVARESAQQARELFLSQGTLIADVSPQSAPFSVKSPHARATVLGTRFSIDVMETVSLLKVIEGRVRFARSAEAGVIVQSGYQAKLGPDTEQVERIPLIAKSIPEPVPQPTDALDHEAKKTLVTSLTLIDVETEKPIPALDPIADGATISLSRLPSPLVNFRANTLDKDITHLSFQLYKFHRAVKKPCSYKIEKYSPYTFPGDQKHEGGDYQAWKFGTGTFEMEITPSVSEGGKDVDQTPFRLKFTVSD